MLFPNYKKEDILVSIAKIINAPENSICRAEIKETAAAIDIHIDRMITPSEKAMNLTGDAFYRKPDSLQYKPYTANEICILKEAYLNSNEVTNALYKVVGLTMKILPLRDRNNHSLIDFQMRQLKEEGFVCYQFGSEEITVVSLNK